MRNKLETWDEIQTRQIREVLKQYAKERQRHEQQSGSRQSGEVGHSGNAPEGEVPDVGHR
jgi:hypothetical protein